MVLQPSVNKVESIGVGSGEGIDLLNGQVLAVLGVGRVADFVERSDELVNLVLFEPDAQAHGVIARCAALQLPAFRNFTPCVPNGEVVPAFGDGVGRRQLRQCKDEES